MPDDGPPEQELAERMGVRLDPDLLRQALTHRSYAYEHGGPPTNERLEFLGDAVLGLVVAEAGYRDLPGESEGRLAKLRAAVVNADALAAVGRALGVGEFLLLGRGETGDGGGDKVSILADAVEALVGAVYLDQGLEAARALVLSLCGPALRAARDMGPGLDWKTSLQELTARRGLGVPDYVVEESGPEHDKTFRARVRLADALHGDGVGRSKKHAEQLAAASAYRELSPDGEDAGAGAR